MSVEEPSANRHSAAVVTVIVAEYASIEQLSNFLEAADDAEVPSIEIVVVANPATRHAVETLVAQSTGNARLASGSASNRPTAQALGIRTATTELVFLTTAAIRPTQPDWPTQLSTLLRADTVAVSGLMIAPTSKGRRGKVPSCTEFGVSFTATRSGVEGVSREAGTEIALLAEAGPQEVPAVSSTAMLARRTSLLECAPDQRFVPPISDWDLCLRLARLGRIVVSPDVTFVDESSPERMVDVDEGALRLFNDVWSPAIRRKLREELTEPPSRSYYRVDEPRRLLLTGEDRQITKRLARDARAAGFEVTGDEHSHVDMAVAVDVPSAPSRFQAHDSSIAMVTARHDAWARSGVLDSAKRVVVPDRIGAALLQAAWGRDMAAIDRSVFDGSVGGFARLLEMSRPEPHAMRIGVSTAAPDWTKAQRWGDTFLARGLMRAFRRLGHETSELIRADWSGQAAASCDVVVHLRGSRRRPTAQGQWNVLWIISHPERVERSEYDDYDLICVASDEHARLLTDRLGRPVHYLPQATDSDTFMLRRFDPELAAPVLYVGIARWPNRRAPRWMIRKGRQFDLHGRGWEGMPEATMLRSEHLDNRDLAAAYGSASVVVADHHGTMRTNGFVANRVFDVLASGGVVVSDDVGGLHRMFGSTVPVYRDADELESLLRNLLSNSPMRRKLSRQGRDLVWSEHTLDHRAATMLELLDEL